MGGHVCGLGWDRFGMYGAYVLLLLNSLVYVFHLLTVSLTAVARHYSKSATGLGFDLGGGLGWARVGLCELGLGMDRTQVPWLLNSLVTYIPLIDSFPRSSGAALL